MLPRVKIRISKPISSVAKALGKINPANMATVIQLMNMMP